MIELIKNYKIKLIYLNFDQFFTNFLYLNHLVANIIYYWNYKTNYQFKNS